MSNPLASPCPGHDEEYLLPTVEALMAGTLALMTGYAQCEPGHDHRPLMARKLVANLCALAEHPDLSAPMRCMLSKLRTRWHAVAGAGALPAEPTPLWHPAPGVVQ